MINTVLIRKGAATGAVIISFYASGEVLYWQTSDASTITITPVSDGTNIGSVAASGSYTLTRPITTGQSRTDVYTLNVDGGFSTATASVYWAQTCTVVCIWMWNGECGRWSECP